MSMPNGFFCKCCGRRSEFGMYVFAHWDITLSHTCPDCGEVSSVLRGHVERVERGKVPEVKREV
jgi:hypothetical protein